jgi:hypothetical protein
MIRRAFVRSLSGAILCTLLGVKPWRLEEDRECELLWYGYGPSTPVNTDARVIAFESWNASPDRDGWIVSVVARHPFGEVLETRFVARHESAVPIYPHFIVTKGTAPPA